MMMTFFLLLMMDGRLRPMSGLFLSLLLAVGLIPGGSEGLICFRCSNTDPSCANPLPTFCTEATPVCSRIKMPGNILRKACMASVGKLGCQLKYDANGEVTEACLCDRDLCNDDQDLNVGGTPPPFIFGGSGSTDFETNYSTTPRPPRPRPPPPPPRTPPSTEPPKPLSRKPLKCYSCLGPYDCKMSVKCNGGVCKKVARPKLGGMEKGCIPTRTPGMRMGCEMEDDGSKFCLCDDKDLCNPAGQPASNGGLIFAAISIFIIINYDD